MYVCTGRIPQETVVSKFIVKAYEITTEPVQGICKQPCIWGNNRGRTAPLVYLQKPKWISEESFLEIIQGLELNMPEIEITGTEEIANE